MANFIATVVKAVKEGRFLYLLIILMGYLILSPFLQDFVRLRLLYYIFLTALLVSSIVAIGGHRRHTTIAIAMAVPMVLLIWIAYIHPSLPVRLSANIVTLLFLVYVISLILIFVFTTRQVTRHVIFGAISVYLLIGITWSIVYTVMESLAPGSFSQTPDPKASQPAFFVYFSFVTITTLGYGDITPLTPKAQSLVIAEALVGQIYMTVLIAWLVGLYVSQKTT